MGNKLSHSSINRYLMCGESYRLHYIEKIRPTTTTSALIFGAALDNSLNSLLLEKDLNLARRNFEEQFRIATINDEQIFVPTSTQILYSKTDFDNDILSEVDIVAIEEKIKELGLPTNSDYLSVFKEVKKNNVFGEKGVIFHNFCNWLSLKQKGLLMLESYNNKIIPKIKRVLAIQKEFTLNNGIGDSVIGLIDLIAEIEGYGVVILDNKTAGRPYKDDSVITSEQLSMYMHAVGEEYNTRLAGYIVMLKTVNKNRVKICEKCGFNGSSTLHTTCAKTTDAGRCKGTYKNTISPEIDIQLIIDKLPLKKELEVINVADDVNEKISNKQFTKCTSQCENWFGSRCAFYNYCYNNGDMTGLIKKENK